MYAYFYAYRYMHTINFLFASFFFFSVLGGRRAGKSGEERERGGCTGKRVSIPIVHTVCLYSNCFS